MFLIILIISIETLTMRVLITVPTKSGYGGVTNYYLGIKEYWKENIEYFYFGRKPWRNIFYPFLIIRFIIRLICFKTRFYIFKHLPIFQKENIRIYSWFQFRVC